MWIPQNLKQPGLLEQSLPFSHSQWLEVSASEPRAAGEHFLKLEQLLVLSREEGKGLRECLLRTLLSGSFKGIPKFISNTRAALHGEAARLTVVQAESGDQFGSASTPYAAPKRLAQLTSGNLTLHRNTDMEIFGNKNSFTRTFAKFHVKREANPLSCNPSTRDNT